jgi:hypothetical protein
MKIEACTASERDCISEINIAHFPRRHQAVVRYKAIGEHLCCDLNGEAVVLSLKNGKYYGLNGVGARIWELIQTPLSLAELESAILLEYDVDSELCKEQVSEFLKQMETEELIEIVHEPIVEIF